jgi:cytidylate kinase
MATITISRETGSDKGDFAPELARLLGYDLLDKDIIRLVAQQIHAPEGAVPDVDEIQQRPSGRVRALFERILQEERNGVHKPQLSPWFAETYPFEIPSYYDTDYQRYSREEIGPAKGKPLSREAAVQGYVRIIKHFAEQGHVVIVGRGAQVILKDVHWVFHLRLTASRKARIANVAEKTALPDDEAAKFMDRSDLWRARYVKENFSVDWNDVSLYHMTVNMDKWKSYKLAEAVAAIVKSESFRETLQDLKKHYGKF